MAVAVVGVTTGFSVTGSASVAVCAKNTARVRLLIQNQDPANSVYVCFGTLNAATVAAGILVAPGNNLDLQGQSQYIGGRMHTDLFDGDVAVIAAPGTTVQISVTEK